MWSTPAAHPSCLARHETQGAFACFVIGKLLRRRLHEIARRSDKRAADAAVERYLGAPYRIDHHSGGIGRVPHFKLELGIERHAAEGRSLEPDVGDLAVAEPRHEIARAD